MKKYLQLALSLSVVVTTLSSCNEDNFLGSSVLPNADKRTVHVDTISLQSETVFQDSVYLRNSLAVLGKITDPVYGRVESDFISQLYCPYNFKFPNDVTSIDSAFIYLYYSSWFGDSTEIQHINVWEVDKQNLNVSPSYSSSINPLDYTTKTKLLAEGSFAPADFGSTDSVKQLSSYQRVIRMPLDSNLCKRFLNDSRNPDLKFNFATPEAFANYFKGIYVTTDQGDGSLFYIHHIEMGMFFNSYFYNNSLGLQERDSITLSGAYFPVTKEVRQVNRVVHKGMDRMLKVTPSDTLNYIYAPSGMFTKVHIPTSIFQKNSGKLSGKTINSMMLTLNASSLEDDFKLSMGKPQSLLLIDASKVDEFFKGFNLNDGLYSFLATYDDTDENYVFNLSYYAQKMIRENDNSNTDFVPFTEMLVVPVDVVKNKDGTNIRLEHIITPAALKICSGTNLDKPMHLKVIYSGN